MKAIGYITVVTILLIVIAWFWYKKMYGVAPVQITETPPVTQLPKRNIFLYRNGDDIRFRS